MAIDEALVKAYIRTMFLKLLSRIFGSSNDREVKKLLRHVPAINALEERYSAMSDDELRHQTALFRERLAAGQTLDDIMHEA
ncbi:MAG TPA: hypothetical protein PLO23_10315, partial [Alphaproteobacteria bacterium]|nr:hypothetical protein [Alphaproteobacteria bacterium]